ncbi:hypothetical protein BC830DRAFT_1145971 [Chytriomyces sp. MP71]|nr:hypothetical protein BC830DRAFT_1145971 [Chytriomyces sp. MP71]
MMDKVTKALIKLDLQLHKRVQISGLIIPESFTTHGPAEPPEMLFQPVGCYDFLFTAQTATSAVVPDVATCAVLCSEFAYALLAPYSQTSAECACSDELVMPVPMTSCSAACPVPAGTDAASDPGQSCGGITPDGFVAAAAYSVAAVFAISTASVETLFVRQTLTSSTTTTFSPPSFQSPSSTAIPTIEASATGPVSTASPATATATGTKTETAESSHQPQPSIDTLPSTPLTPGAIGALIFSSILLTFCCGFFVGVHACRTRSRARMHLDDHGDLRALMVDKDSSAATLDPVISFNHDFRGGTATTAGGRQSEGGGVKLTATEAFLAELHRHHTGGHDPFRGVAGTDAEVVVPLYQSHLGSMPSVLRDHLAREEARSVSVPHRQGAMTASTVSECSGFFAKRSSMDTSVGASEEDEGLSQAESSLFMRVMADNEELEWDLGHPNNSGSEAT